MKMGVIFILIQVLSISAFADGHKGGTHPEGGGIPSLNNLANTKAELADGEVYNLSGTIVFLNDGLPYLQVDMKKYPWLANAKRIAFPYYQLSGEADFWHRYEGNHVQYICLAAGGFITAADGTPSYAIALNPAKGSPDESMTLDEDRARGSAPNNHRH